MKELYELTRYGRQREWVRVSRDGDGVLISIRPLGSTETATIRLKQDEANRMAREIMDDAFHSMP